MRHPSKTHASTFVGKRSWRMGAAFALLLALALTLAIPPAHAAPPDSQKQQPTSQALVSPAALAPAVVVPNSGSNCLAMTLTIQSLGGAVKVNMSFKNTCFQDMWHVTFWLRSSVQCGYTYSGNVNSNGSLNPTTVVPVAGSASLLTNQVYSSSCLIQQNHYLNYTMTTTGHVDAVVVNSTVTAYGQITVTGTYH